MRDDPFNLSCGLWALLTIPFVLLGCLVQASTERGQSFVGSLETLTAAPPPWVSRELLEENTQVGPRLRPILEQFIALDLVKYEDYCGSSKKVVAFEEECNKLLARTPGKSFLAIEAGYYTLEMQVTPEKDFLVRVIAGDGSIISTTSPTHVVCEIWQGKDLRLRSEQSLTLYRRERDLSFDRSIDIYYCIAEPNWADCLQTGDCWFGSVSDSSCIVKCRSRRAHGSSE